MLTCLQWGYREACGSSWSWDHQRTKLESSGCRAELFALSLVGSGDRKGHKLSRKSVGPRIPWVHIALAFSLSKAAVLPPQKTHQSLWMKMDENASVLKTGDLWAGGKSAHKLCGQHWGLACSPAGERAQLSSAVFLTGILSSSLPHYIVPYSCRKEEATCGLSPPTKYLFLHSHSLPLPEILFPTPVQTSPLFWNPGWISQVQEITPYLFIHTQWSAYYYAQLEIKDNGWPAFIILETNTKPDPKQVLNREVWSVQLSTTPRDSTKPNPSKTTVSSSS